MLKIGQRFKDRYTILQILDQGGFSTVYLIKDQDHQLYALKEIAAENFNQGLNEVHMLLALHNDGIVQIKTTYQDTHFYLVLEYIEGENLMKYRKNKLDCNELVMISIQICKIVSFLHTRNPTIIHGDLKPANLMYTPQKKVKLIDFGTAKYKEREDKVPLGTRGFSAPELFRGAKASVQTDIYSIGMTLLYLLEGRWIVDASLLENQDPLIQIIRRCLQENVEERYHSVSEILSDLRKVKRRMR